jgi:hypothetical protein
MFWYTLAVGLMAIAGLRLLDTFIPVTLLPRWFYVAEYFVAFIIAFNNIPGH